MALIFFCFETNHYKKTWGFWWPKSLEIRRNRPIPTNFRRTCPSVSFCRKKKIRRNFVRTSDDFLTNTEKRHSDELPTILRCGHTRPEFIGKTMYRRRTFLGQFRRSGFLGVFRRTMVVGIFRRTVVVGIYRRLFVRRNIPTNIGSSVNSDGYLSVGIFRRPLSVGIYRII